MSDMTEVHVRPVLDLSVDDVVTLAVLTGEAVPLDVVPASTPPPDRPDPQALESLRARGLVEGDPPAVRAGLAEIVRMAARPVLFVRVETTIADGTRLWDFFVHPEWLVQQVPQPGGRLLWAVAGATELMTLVVEASLLTKRPERSGSVTVAASGLLELDVAVAAGGLDRVAALLPADDRTAAELAQALVRREATAAVTIAHAFGGARVLETVSWLDGGEAGLWETRLAGSDPSSPESITWTATSARELAELIVARFPNEL